MTFPATIHAVKVDHEGESRITLTVPLEALDQAMKLPALTGKLLNVTITEA